MIQMSGYPVLVRVDTMHRIDMKLGEHEEVKESKEISLQFIAAHWFVAGDHEYNEKGAFIIFVSENTFNELSRPRKFSAHYIEHKGWRCADDLSADTRNELLSLAMRKAQ